MIGGFFLFQHGITREKKSREPCSPIKAEVLNNITVGV
jgi:hypothetical protein